MNAYITQLTTLAHINKYTAVYIDLVTRAQCRTLDVATYTEKHHIVPKSFGVGGEKDSKNIAILTAKEHYICHLLMTRMFSGKNKQKMYHAFRGLVGAKSKVQGLRYSSRLYSFFKERLHCQKYIRVYYEDKVKWLLDDDHISLVAYLDQGWSTTMTPEYKVGRVGNMAGKKHSATTRDKQKQARAALKAAGYVQPKRSAETQAAINKKLRGVQRTDEYKRADSERMKLAHKEGRKNSKGTANGNYGLRKIKNPQGETKRVRVDELEKYFAGGWILTNRYAKLSYS